MEYVIGLDGGGTKTTAVVTQTDGRIIGGIQAGLSNFQRVGPNGLKQVCHNILDQVQNKFGIARNDISYWTLGLAGAGRKEDQRSAEESVESLGLSKKVTVESDAYISLLGAFGGRPGIIVIAGTGSICFGLDEQGELHRSGGWGYLLGDEGSGYYIGHQALLAALKDFDGRGDKTILREKIEQFLNLSAMTDIVRKIYIENTIQKEDIASLAPIIFEIANEGDRIAQQIVTQTGEEIAKMILAVGTKMNKINKSIEIAYIGSIFKQKETLLPIILKSLKPNFSDVQIHEPMLESAKGAVVLALQKLNIKITHSVLQNLKMSYELAK